MDHAHATHSEHTEPPPFWRSRYAVGLLVFGVFGAVAAYFLLSEHRAYFIGALPFLLLLSCPLMHIFMHHGHVGHGKDDESHGDSKQGSQKSSVQQESNAGDRL